MEVETSALRRRLEGKEEELIRLQTTIDSQTASIEDLNVRLPRGNRFDADPPSQRILVDSTDGVQNGHELVNMTQELERVRRTAETQHAEFEVMKRNLVRDITDRCEKASRGAQLRRSRADLSLAGCRASNRARRVQGEIPCFGKGDQCKGARKGNEGYGLQYESTLRGSAQCKLAV